LPETPILNVQKGPDKGKKILIKPQIFQREVLELHQHPPVGGKRRKMDKKMGLNIADFATGGDEAGANFKLKRRRV